MNDEKTEGKYYSIGEMAKLGLVKNRLSGGAIKDRANLGRVLRGADFKLVQTKYGLAKCLSQEQIDAYNAGVNPRYGRKKVADSQEG